MLSVNSWLIYSAFLTVVQSIWSNSSRKNACLFSRVQILLINLECFSWFSTFYYVIWLVSSSLSLARSSSFTLTSFIAFESRESPPSDISSESSSYCTTYFLGKRATAFFNSISSPNSLYVCRSCVVWNLCFDPCRPIFTRAPNLSDSLATGINLSFISFRYRIGDVVAAGEFLDEVNRWDVCESLEKDLDVGTSDSEELSS